MHSVQWTTAYEFCHAGNYESVCGQPKWENGDLLFVNMNNKTVQKFKHCNNIIISVRPA